MAPTSVRIVAMFDVRLIAAAMVFAFGWIPASPAADIGLRIMDPPATGTVYVLLYDSAAAFEGLRNPMRTERYGLDGREVYRLSDVPAGSYALVVHHDVNGNGIIDRNFIGIPKEPIAFSNGYRPKGPPSYRRAAFLLGPDDNRVFDVALAMTLGKRGRVGTGVGVIGRSSPYRDYDGNVLQPIPAITYVGTRLQIYGTNGQFGLFGNDRVRMALVGRYRIGVYEEDESPFLRGMGDREDTFMAGLALRLELPHNLGMSAQYTHDVLDRIGGGSASLQVDTSVPYGPFRFSPGLALNWLSSSLSNHDYGVPAISATEDRPAYDLDDTIGLEAGLDLFVDVTQDWLVIVNFATEWLDDDITDSPIVDEDYVVQCFAAVSYLF